MWSRSGGSRGGPRRDGANRRVGCGLQPPHERCDGGIRRRRAVSGARGTSQHLGKLSPMLRIGRFGFGDRNSQTSGQALWVRVRVRVKVKVRVTLVSGGPQPAHMHLPLASNRQMPCPIHRMHAIWLWWRVTRHGLRVRRDTKFGIFTWRSPGWCAPSA
jgi:hypothetical protein